MSIFGEPRTSKRANWLVAAALLSSATIIAVGLVFSIYVKGLEPNGPKGTCVFVSTGERFVAHQRIDMFGRPFGWEFLDRNGIATIINSDTSMQWRCQR